MYINYFDPTNTTGPEGYINYKLSRGRGGSGKKRGGGKKGPRRFGLGSLVLLIVMSMAILLDISGDVSEGTLIFLVVVEVLIIFIAVSVYVTNN